MSTLSRAQQNQLLTQTNADTPMGKLFRRYWLPVLLLEELPEPDCAPVRVKVLGENLLAFRDSNDKLGLIDEFCPHRGVSLWFGRNEEGGLRCPYHGWKFDVTGQCMQIPSEPAESNYAKRIKLTSYPLVERGGVFWTYMGPPELQPAVPEFEFAMVGPKQRFVSKRWQMSNYLQSMEGGYDPAHVSFLHSGEIKSEAMIATSNSEHFRQDERLKMECVQSDGGIVLSYGREVGGGNTYWRVMQWVMPYYTMIPPFGDHPVHGHFWVPIDDENCFVWTFDFHPSRDLSEGELQAGREGRGLHVKIVEGSNYVPVANKSNNYLIDRRKQKDGLHYSGVPSIAMADAALQENMGTTPIQDRTREHLVTTDRAIVMVRRLMIESALALEKEGKPPRGLEPKTQRVRSATVILPSASQVLAEVKASIENRPGAPFLTA